MNRRIVSVVTVVVLAAFGAGFYVLSDWMEESRRPDAIYVMGEGGRRVRLTADEYRKQEAEAKEAREALAKARKEISDLEKGIEKARGEAAVLRGRVKDLEDAAAAGGMATIPAEALTAEARDRKVREIVDAADWRSYGGAVARWVLGEEQSRLTGQPFVPSTDDLMTLSMLNGTMAEVAKVLGLKNLWDGYKNPIVSEKFMPSYLEGLGVAFNDQQRDQLNAVIRQQAERASTLAATAAAPGSLEWTLEEAKENADFDSSLSRILTRDQMETYSRTVGANPYFGMQVPRQPLSRDASQAADAITGMWAKSFGLDDTQRQAASAVAQQYFQEALGARREFSTRYGRSIPRDQAMALQLRFLELQIEAERALAERLGMSPDQADKVRRGSGTIVVFPEE